MIAIEADGAPGAARRVFGRRERAPAEALGVESLPPPTGGNEA